MSLRAGPTLLALGGTYEAKSQHCAAARCYLAVQKTPDTPEIQVLGALKLARLLISNFDNVDDAISALLTAVSVQEAVLVGRGELPGPGLSEVGLGHQTTMSMVQDEVHGTIACVRGALHATPPVQATPADTAPSRVGLGAPVPGLPGPGLPCRLLSGRGQPGFGD